MPNLMRYVERLKVEKAKGWPDGTDQLYAKIPMLLDRIAELENALVPFARVFMTERANPNASPEYVVNVYLKHCQKALEVIDINQADPIPMDNFFSIPAEM